MLLLILHQPQRIVLRGIDVGQSYTHFGKREKKVFKQNVPERNTMEAEDTLPTPLFPLAILQRMTEALGSTSSLLSAK